MTPKLAIGCLLGTGGTLAGGCIVFNYFHEEEIIVLNNPTLEGIGADICTTPIKKATITMDESVVYYICTEISNPFPNENTNSITTHFTSSGKSSFTQKTTSNTTPNPRQGTYKRENKSPEIDIYLYTETTGKVKNIFLIKVPNSENSPINLQNDDGIRHLIKDIEELRAYQSIVIADQSTTKTIDSISCTSPKKATFLPDNAIEYYICTEITDSFTSLAKNDTVPKISTTFVYNNEFKNKVGDKHNITKGNDQTTSPTLTFYGFNPKDTHPQEQEVFFLKGKESTCMSDEKSKDWILKIKQFKKG